MPEGSFDENHRPEISTLDAPKELLEDSPLKNINKLETTARVLALIGGSGLLGGGCIATIGSNPAVNNIYITKVGVNLCGPSTIIGFVGILMLRAMKKQNKNTKKTPPIVAEDKNDNIVMDSELSPEERQILVNAIRKATY